MGCRWARTFQSPITAMQICPVILINCTWEDRDCIPQQDREKGSLQSHCLTVHRSVFRKLSVTWRRVSPPGSSQYHSTTSSLWLFTYRSTNELQATSKLRERKGHLPLTGLYSGQLGQQNSAPHTHWSGRKIGSLTSDKEVLAIMKKRQEVSKDGHITWAVSGGRILP